MSDLRAALERLADDVDRYHGGTKPDNAVFIDDLRAVLAAHPAPDERDNRIRAEAWDRAVAHVCEMVGTPNIGWRNPYRARDASPPEAKP